MPKRRSRDGGLTTTSRSVRDARRVLCGVAIFVALIGRETGVSAQTVITSVPGENLRSKVWRVFQDGKELTDDPNRGEN